MARRKKNALIQQLGIVAAVLIAFQLGYLFLVPRPKAVSIKAAIQQQLDKQTIDATRKEQLRIQLSIEDYLRTEGHLPEKLDLLVPRYFDEVPKVPDTGQPFQYFVKETKYYVGDTATIAAAKGEKTTVAAATSNIIPALDSGIPLSPAVQKALIDSLGPDAALHEVAFTYDPTGKRDPFLPFDFTPKGSDNANKTPLEQYDLAQLKLTAVLGGGAGDVTATVENAAGKGFIVKKGMKIGINSGEVVDIQPDRLVIVETATDFTGQKKTKTVELRLRTKDQENARSGR